MKILISFRSVKEELQEKLPSNCQIYTVHTLTYKHFGRKERIADEHQLVSKIIDLLDLKNKSGYTYGFFLRDLLFEFVHSLDKKVRFTRDMEDIFKTAKIGSKIVEYYRTGKSEFLIGVPYHIKLLIESGEVKSAEELAEKLTDEIGDFEHGYAIYLALKYDINFLYRKAIRMNSPDAKTVLSTAHSAKGLQFDKVNFNSDFPEFEVLLKAHVRNVYGEKKNIEKEDIQKVINCIYTSGEKLAIASP